MKKYIICYKYTDEAVEEVEADSEEEAIDLVCEKEDLVWIKEEDE